MTRQVVRFDRDVGHRLIPGLQARARQAGAPYLLRTNSAGFRSGELETSRPDGCRRILVYGDSFTEGVGVSDGRRFTDLLEDMLPDVEVVNFGVRATGTDQQYLMFRELPPAVEYDLVVVGLYSADVKRAASKYGVLSTPAGASYQKPYFQRGDDGELVLHNVPVPSDAVDSSTLGGDERKMAYRAGLTYRLRVAVAAHAPWAKAALQRITRYQPAPYLASSDDPAWLLARAIVERWADEASTPLLVLAIPPYQYVEGLASSRGYRARLAELEAGPRVAVHDTLDDLIEARKAVGRDALRISGDAHYTAVGHEVIARSAVSAVAELLASTRAETPGGLA